MEHSPPREPSLGVVRGCRRYRHRVAEGGVDLKADDSGGRTCRHRHWGEEVVIAVDEGEFGQQETPEIVRRGIELSEVDSGVLELPPPCRGHSWVADPGWQHGGGRYDR